MKLDYVINELVEQCEDLTKVALDVGGDYWRFGVLPQVLGYDRNSKKRKNLTNPRDDFYISQEGDHTWIRCKEDTLKHRRSYKLVKGRWDDNTFIPDEGQARETVYEESLLRWEKVVDEVFSPLSEYHKWKLLIDEECLYLGNLERRKEFVEKFKIACFNGGYSYADLLGHVVWYYPIHKDDVDEKLKLLGDEMFKSVWGSKFEVTKTGTIKTKCEW